MLTSLFHAGTFSLSSVAIALGMAIILGVLIALTFKALCAESSSFTICLAVLPLLVTIVIMIVNGNLGASVAVLGAFGLVRFRSAPGNGREILFIFFSMAIGLALGMGFIGLAVIGFVLVALTLAVVSIAGLGSISSREQELRITIPEDLNYNGLFDDLFASYAKKAELRHVKTVNMGTMYELCYRIILKKSDKEKEFLDALRCRNGNLTVRLGMVGREKNEL
ncbi:MAG: DUF4956 domain-containing protein [Clostridia bacterium]|nr:DUF4956 domain-containing protein [Clostridia bacterium]